MGCGIGGGRIWIAPLFEGFGRPNLRLAGTVEIKLPRGRHWLAMLVVASVAAGIWMWARSAAVVPLAQRGARIGARPAATAARSPTLASTLTLTVDTTRPGSMFDRGAVGLSTEATELSNGHLTAEHHRLVRLMRLLGRSVLRIGGGSVDLSWWTSTGEPPPPWAASTVTPADLRRLHGLLIATGWRLVLGVDFGHFEPTRAAAEARIAQRILGRSLLGIEIGNEPDAYGNKQNNLRPPSYAVGEYLHEAEAYRQALSATAPSVVVYGPALSISPPWTQLIGAAGHMFAQVTQHYYPINICPNTSPVSPQPTTAELLSPEVREQENQTLEVLARAGVAAGRPTRLGETNSVACSSQDDANPGFAGALWSLDWILRAVSSGVKGLNFHGAFSACRLYSESPACVLGDQAAINAGDVMAQPEYYGLLAASRLQGGRFVPTSLRAPAPSPNLTTWATVAPDGTVRVAIDNLAVAGSAQLLSIPVSGYTATEELLAAPAAQAMHGISFGGDPVTAGGRWRPRPVSLARVHGSVRVVIRPAGAVIVTLRRSGFHR